MQIQTIEKKTGLDRATIRYYEQEGLIIPQRLQNGYRDYSQDNLQDLLKIKLLRQLGLSVDTISQIIAGEYDLQTALGNQLVVLKNIRTQVDDVEAICNRMLQDKVTYETIDPHKYFGYTGVNKNRELTERQRIEYVYKQSHPVRHFVGRHLDQFLLTAILMLVLIVILRVRPLKSVQFISVISLFLCMPINALFLSLFGTTPGKFVMGIYLKTEDGKNISFLDALAREWDVFHFGMGYSIPIYSWIRLYKSYKTHTEGWELEWDYGHNGNVQYTTWNYKKLALSIVLCIISVIFIIFSSINAQFPKYRSENITLTQYAKNYNGYARLNDFDRYLSDKGEWTTPFIEDNSVIVEVLNDFETTEDRWQFITDDQQYLKEIRIETELDSGLFYFGGGDKYLAIYTAVMSQPETNLLEAGEMMNQLSEVTFIENLGLKRYDFNGVVVNFQTIELEDDPQGRVNLIIDITLP